MAEVIQFSQKAQQELTKLGFDYHKLKKNGFEINKHLTLLYEQITLPNISSQKYRDTIRLMIGVGNPKDSEKAVVDYMYTAYVRIEKRTECERDLLTVTFNSKDGDIPKKTEIPGKMERLIREVEIGQKFGIDRKEEDSHNNSISNKSKIKR